MAARQPVTVGPYSVPLRRLNPYTASNRLRRRVRDRVAEGDAMPSTSELLDRFVILFNENRIEEGEDDYAPQGYAEEIGTGRRMTPAENSASAKAWREAFPDANGTITCKLV